jgi:murein DD-endopeptidase MepM/ murein hydrolase activator NlpD
VSSYNRYYTILVVPEKTSQMKRFFIPSWVVKSSFLGLAILVLLTGIMLFDYFYVMSQIGENKELKIENHRLRQQVQIFQNKINTIETTMDRIKTFSTRLRVIMHLEEEEPTHSESDLEKEGWNIPALHSHTSFSSSPLFSSFKEDPEMLELQKEYDQLQHKISHLHEIAFEIEEKLQNEYEMLYDKKAFLAALPTQKPAEGYFTSGFGVRTSPYGNRIKMHEGVDIANRPGTSIRAPADAEVTYAAYKTGYGLTLILNHGYGLETWYGHLQKFAVSPGEKIKRGTQIAFLGNTGLSTGPHVHYEVRVHGYPVDPLSYIFEDSRR